MKRCSKCGCFKDSESFYRQRSRKDGRRATCKDCDRLSNQLWQQKNPENAKEKWRKASAKYSTRERTRARTLRKYKLTQADFDRFLAQQGGVCAICKRDPQVAFPTHPWFLVDHDHKTQRVRGLLCVTCNTGLGAFCDDLSLLKEAWLYLARAVQSD